MNVAISAPALAAILVTIGGCQWPPPDNWFGRKDPPQKTNVAGQPVNLNPTVTVVSDQERSDIVQVHSFVATNPWLIFDPMEGKIDGFKCNVYLEAPLRDDPTGKGVKGFFGDGTIIVQMFRADGEDNDRSKMELVQTWELPPGEAYKWRAKNMTAMGWGYGLRLRWPSELDVAGKKVAFLVNYQRKDGLLISASQPKVRRVPIRGV